MASPQTEEHPLSPRIAPLPAADGPGETVLSGAPQSPAAASSGASSPSSAAVESSASEPRLSSTSPQLTRQPPAASGADVGSRGKESPVLEADSSMSLVRRGSSLSLELQRKAAWLPILVASGLNEVVWGVHIALDIVLLEEFTSYALLAIGLFVGWLWVCVNSVKAMCWQKTGLKIRNRNFNRMFTRLFVYSGLILIIFLFTLLTFGVDIRCQVQKHGDPVWMKWDETGRAAALTILKGVQSRGYPELSVVAEEVFNEQDKAMAHATTTTGICQYRNDFIFANIAAILLYYFILLCRALYKIEKV